MRRRYITIILAALITSNAFGAFVPVIVAGEKGTVTLLRRTANEDPNTAIASIDINALTAGDWANKPTKAQGLVTFDDDGVDRTSKYYMGIMACAESAANKTFTTKIWFWWKGGSPAVQACSIAWTTGTQAVVKYPHSGTACASAYWADTGVITYPQVPTSSGTDGGNSVKIVVLDTMGADAVYCEVEDADGSTGDEAGNVTVYWFNVSG